MRPPTRLGSVAAISTVTYNQAMATTYMSGMHATRGRDSSGRRL